MMNEIRRRALALMGMIVLMVVAAGVAKAAAQTTDCEVGGEAGVVTYWDPCLTPDDYVVGYDPARLVEMAELYESWGVSYYDERAADLRRLAAEMTVSNPLRTITDAKGAPTVSEAVFGIDRDDPLLEIWDRPTPPYSAGTWQPLVERFFKPADVAKAMRVMGCETAHTYHPDIQWSQRLTDDGLSPYIEPATYASGLFQQMPRYFDERAIAAGYPGADIYDPEANVAVAAWLVYEGGGWRHWPNCRWAG